MYLLYSLEKAKPKYLSGGQRHNSKNKIQINTANHTTTTIPVLAQDGIKR